jgi:hypothetical protein
MRPIKNQSNLFEIEMSSIGIMIVAPKTPKGTKAKNAVCESAFSPVTLLNKLLITL